MKIDYFDQFLSYYSDELSSLTSMEGKALVSEKITGPESIKLLVKKLMVNKISLERLYPLANNICEESRNIILKQREKDIQFREKWDQMLKYIIALFNKNDVQYILIKVLNYPWTIASDLDILALNPMEELKALEALDNDRFSIFEFRLLAHPLKVMAVSPSHEDPHVSVDFYPEPMWYRKKICDTDIIFSRKQIMMVNCIETFVPSLEDSLYLTGTHAYNHLIFSLAEILHGLNIISKRDVDWKYLFNLAYNYGTLDAIYLYLKLLNMYSVIFRNYPIIDGQVFSSYEANKYCRNLKSWLNSFVSFEMPIVVPSKIGSVYSSIYHCTKMLGRVPLIDLSYDFLTHYLAMTARIVFGKA